MCLSHCHFQLQCLYCDFKALRNSSCLGISGESCVLRLHCNGVKCCCKMSSASLYTACDKSFLILAIACDIFHVGQCAQTLVVVQVMQ